MKEPLSSQAGYLSEIVMTRSGTTRRLVWREGYDNNLAALFKVNDETGYTLVDPTNADIETEKPYQLITNERELSLLGLAP